jgi:hypothetical protein
VDALLPACYRGWYGIAFPEPLHIGVKDPASDDDRLLVCLGAAPAVRWAVRAGTSERVAARPDIALAAMVERSPRSVRWREAGAIGALRLVPSPRLGEADNVVDGYHRRFSRAPTHMWISDPAQDFPQHLVLSWPEPLTLDTVMLTFDNLAPSRHQYPWELGTRAIPWCVRDYVLAVWTGDDWREIVSERDNHHRFRTHTFAPLATTQLRLTVRATHVPGHSARVYQLSVYDRASLTTTQPPNHGPHRTWGTTQPPIISRKDLL